MKKILGGKAVTAVVIALAVVMLGGIIALAVYYYENLDFLESQTTFLDGEYSVDDGEWKPIDNEKPINDRFHKIVCGAESLFHTYRPEHSSPSSFAVGRFGSFPGLISV